MKNLLSLQLLLLLHFAGFSQVKYLLPVVNETGKWGYIDSTGKQIIPFQYDLAYNFTEERGLVGKKVNSEYKYGFIDVNGTMSGNWNFVEAQPYNNGFALVRFYIDAETLSWGYLDKNGLISPPISCSDASGFSGGLAAVNKMRGWVFINKNFQETIHGRYTAVGSFSEGLCAVAFGRDSLQQWGYINSKGLMVTPVSYLHASGFSGHMAAVCIPVDEVIGKKTIKRKLFGYIGGNGDFLIPAKYQEASDFSENLAHVKLNGEEFFIDPMGNKAFSLDSSFHPSDFHYGYAVVYSPSGRAYFVDKSGNIAYDYNFTALTDFINGYSYFTRRNGAKGYLDYNGNIIWQNGVATNEVQNMKSYIKKNTPVKSEKKNNAPPEKKETEKNASTKLILPASKEVTTSESKSKQDSIKSSNSVKAKSEIVNKTKPVVAIKTDSVKTSVAKVDAPNNKKDTVRNKVSINSKQVTDEKKKPDVISKMDTIKPVVAKVAVSGIKKDTVSKKDTLVSKRIAEEKKKPDVLPKKDTVATTIAKTSLSNTKKDSVSNKEKIISKPVSEEKKKPVAKTVSDTMKTSAAKIAAPSVTKKDSAITEKSKPVTVGKTDTLRKGIDKVSIPVKAENLKSNSNAAHDTVSQVKNSNAAEIVSAKNPQKFAQKDTVVFNKPAANTSPSTGTDKKLNSQHEAAGNSGSAQKSSPVEEKAKPEPEVNDIPVKGNYKKIIYKVQPGGEDLTTLCLSFNCDKLVIMKWNELYDDELVEGTEIKFYVPGKVPSQQENEKPLPQKVSEPKKTATVIPTTAPSPENKMTPKILTLKDASVISPYKYNVIGGAFGNPTNATTFVNTLQNKGYKAFIAGTSSAGLTMVSYGGSDSEQDALALFQKVVQSENNQAWILKK